MHDTTSSNTNKAQDDHNSTLEKPDKTSVKIEEDRNDGNEAESGTNNNKPNNTDDSSPTLLSDSGNVKAEAMEIDEGDSTQQEASKSSPLGDGDVDMKTEDDIKDESMEEDVDQKMESTATSSSEANDDRDSTGESKENGNKEQPPTASKDGGEDENKEVKTEEEDEKKNNSQTTNNNTTIDDKNEEKSNGSSGEAASTTNKIAISKNPNTPTTGVPGPPPLPIMRGTLFYNETEKVRQHIIRGNWQYEDSAVMPAQRFELSRTLKPEEDITNLTSSGEFSGSFSLSYSLVTSKGKSKNRSRVVAESGVKITFTPEEGSGDSKRKFKVEGKGNNQFGVFHILGECSPSPHDGDKVMQIVFRKTYEPAPVAPASNNSNAQGGKSLKAPSKTNGSADDSAPLPDPSPSFSTGVYCLRGKLDKNESQDLGMPEVVHRINGYWAAGLDLILTDTENKEGKLLRFEYEHKSMVPSADFPVSGRYSGWFEWKNDDGSLTRISERDVMLKFRKNNAGFHNVEGKGSNVFGKYSISGSLSPENIITIFRHFAPRKIKALKNVTSAPPPINAPQAKRASISSFAEEPRLKFEDVKVPDDSADSLEPVTAPVGATYSAVSQGVLRVNKDGSHGCQGKWAVAREHLANDGYTSTFNVRLEAHDAVAAAQKAGQDPASQPFPLDSAVYKGSFQLKKQGGSRAKSDTIVDQQVVMKFRQNSQGSFNVYGKGVNAIGVFELFGTLVVIGKTSGQIELYRTYPSDLLHNRPAAKPTSSTSQVAPLSATSSAKPLFPGPPPAGIQRRESTRLVKLPSKLEDDDPKAQLNRTMDKCSQVLRIMKDKDVQMGAFFSEPVDPVALGIPTYYQIIKEPMDLKTVNRRMDMNEIKSPEEFARLMRLIFQNAIKFNIDPAHSVHRAAREMLILFNTKFRDIERLVQKIRKEHGGEGDEKGKKNQEGKNKRNKKQQPPEKPKTPRELRLEEAHAMATENAKSVATIVASAPPNSDNVSRGEFTLLLRMIEQMQHQLVQTHTLLASLFPGEEGSSALATAAVAPQPFSSVPVQQSVLAPPPAPAPEPKKKAPKRKSEVIKEQPLPDDDSTPLTIEEQTLLTETINELDQEHLGGIIQIIREAAPVGADEDEIDLEIDQLDHKTQRKLLRHVSKFVKKKAQPKKKQKTSSTQSKRAKTPPVPKKPVEAPAPKAKAPAADSFFLFGNKDDSDSDSDDEPGEVTTTQPPPSPEAAPTTSKPASSQSGKEFRLTNDLEDMDDEKDDDNEFDFGSGSTSWNISKPSTENAKADGDDDDAWGAAREAAAASKVREAERKAREKKIEIEAENAKNQRLADAAARGEEIRAQRAEEEAKEAEVREQQEKEAEEARKAARDAARAQVQSVEQTVDLDAQRDIMKQYEQNYAGGEYGSASPSSDFGF